MSGALKVVNQIVELVDCMGSDLSIVNAARVSFNKVVTEMEDKDGRLLKYLADHNHWSPFSHVFLSFRIKAPIFVARQLVKHQVGLSWNEVSRRYVDSDPEFFMPLFWRKKAENVKQGSSDEPIYCSEEWHAAATYHTKQLFYMYKNMIDSGICAEQARMILPQNMMTEWIWSGSLYAFARVCNLRLDSHTQRETQEVAKMISDITAEKFPQSWKVLVK